MKTLREKLTREFLEQEDAMHGDGQVKLEDRVDIAIDALRQWLADEGLVVVPREPTVGMFRELTRPFKDKPELEFTFGAWALGSFADDYRAMIAAAPDALREGE